MKDIAAIERVEILDDPETIICVVAIPKEEVAPVAEEAAAAAPAEPEVIKKGKEAADGEGKAETKPEAKAEAKKA